MTQKTNKRSPWHAAALQKFYALNGQSAGLRSANAAANEQLAHLRAKISEVNAERDALLDTIATAPILHGRQADRDRTHDRVTELDADLERLRAVLAEATAAHNAIRARQDRLHPLLNNCANVLVKLRLLRREEAGL